MVPVGEADLDRDGLARRRRRDALERRVEHLHREVLVEVAVVERPRRGELRPDHGEAQHGNLLYQATTHVPLVIAGPGVAPGVSEAPVSTRQIFHTVRDWAGLGAEHRLRSAGKEIVAGVNVGRFDDTFRACQRDCPGLEPADFHLNVAQLSDHYYGNADMPDVEAPESSIVSVTASVARVSQVENESAPLISQRRTIVFDRKPIVSR